MVVVLDVFLDKIKKKQKRFFFFFTTHATSLSPPPPAPPATGGAGGCCCLLLTAYRRLVGLGLSWGELRRHGWPIAHIRGCKAQLFAVDGFGARRWGGSINCQISGQASCIACNRACCSLLGLQLGNVPMHAGFRVGDWAVVKE